MSVISDEYPFTFMNTPSSLQILASAEMALMAWRCKYTKWSHLYERPSLFFINQKFSCREVLVVPVPHRIKAQINEKIVNIGKELQEWIDFHSNGDFLHADSTEAFRKCFRHIVADFSGSIGYKASAINMLNSGEFSDVVNYKIACTFCLEDQVKQFWPSVENDAQIDANPENEKCNLFYWNCYMKSRENLIGATELVKRRIMVATNWKNYGTAFEYFFSLLPDYERLSQTQFFLKNCEHEAVIYLLLTLNRVQAEEVFKCEASAVFGILVRSDKYFQHAHQLWTLMRHVVLENESKFVNLLYELWTIVFFGGFGFKRGLNYTRCDEINNLLLEIWSDTPNELKVYVSDSFFLRRLTLLPLPDKLEEEEEDEKEKEEEFSCHYGHDMKLLLDLLSLCKSQDVCKKKLWMRNWRALALRAKPSCFEKMMRCCLEDDDAVERFKYCIEYRLADFKDLFRALIREGLYSDLKDYLSLFSKNVKQFQRLSEEVLESNLDAILSHDDEKFAEFDWFVGELFSHVKKDVDEFKAHMMSSAESLECLLEARHDYRIHSKNFSSIFNRFATDGGKLYSVKRKLLEHSRSYLTHCDSKIDEWLEFLEWCIVDAEEVSDFKQSFDLDRIFLILLSYHLDHVKYRCLKFLDQLLKWYFVNEEDRKHFKVNKIKNYKQIDILRIMLESNDIDDRFETYDLLKWFFDNDTENLHAFFESCNFSPPSSPRPWMHLVERLKFRCFAK